MQRFHEQKARKRSKELGQHPRRSRSCELQEVLNDLIRFGLDLVVSESRCLGTSQLHTHVRHGGKGSALEMRPAGR